jgi:ribonuclease-3
MEPGDRLPRSLAAAVLESVIAAIYLDGGLQAAREFILAQMEDEIRKATHSDHQYNYKSQLQQYAQRQLRATPMYELLDEKGPDHAKCFEIAVTVGSQQFPGAWGPNKKDAEQKAAWLALRQLGVVSGEFPEMESESEQAAG